MGETAMDKRGQHCKFTHQSMNQNPPHRHWTVVESSLSHRWWSVLLFARPILKLVEVLPKSGSSDRPSMSQTYVRSSDSTQPN